jgi:hypothetical protein
MFEKAIREKYRFATVRGSVTTEDLCDLPLLNGHDVSLDNIAKDLSRAIKDSEEESFVVKRVGSDDILILKLDIVKHIIKTKIEEAECREKKVVIKAKKERIMAILADKQDDTLKGKSEEELKELLEEL